MEKGIDIIRNRYSYRYRYRYSVQSMINKDYYHGRKK